MNRPTFNSKLAATPEDLYNEYNSMTPEELGEAGFTLSEPEAVTRERKDKKKTKRKTPPPGDLTIYAPEPLNYKPRGQKGQKVNVIIDPSKAKKTAPIPNSQYSANNKIKAAMMVPDLTAISAFPCPTCHGAMHGGFPKAPADRPHEQVKCITCLNDGYKLPAEHANLFDNMHDLHTANKRHNDDVNWHETHCLAGACDPGCPINRAVLRHSKSCHPASSCKNDRCPTSDMYVEGKEYHCTDNCDHVLGQGDLETGEGGPLGPLDEKRANYVKNIRENCECGGVGCKNCNDPTIPRHVAFSRTKSGRNTTVLAGYRATVGQKDEIAPAFRIMGGHAREEIKRGTPVWHLGWDKTEPNAALYSEQPQEDYHIYKGPQWGSTVQVKDMPTPADANGDGSLKYPNGVHDENFKQHFQDWTNSVIASNASREGKNFSKGPHSQRYKRDETGTNGYQGKNTFGVVTNVSHDGQWVEGVYRGSSLKDEREALREQLKGQYGGRRYTMRTRGDTVNNTYDNARDEATRKPIQKHISNAMDEIQPLVGERSTVRRGTWVPFACHVSQVARVTPLNVPHLQVVGDIQTTMKKKDVIPNYNGNPDSTFQVIAQHMKPTHLSTEAWRVGMATTPNNEARRRMYGLSKEFEDTYEVPKDHPFNLIPHEMRGIETGHTRIDDAKFEISPETQRNKDILEQPKMHVPMTAEMPGRLNRTRKVEIPEEDVNSMIDTINNHVIKRHGRGLSDEQKEAAAQGIRDEGHIHGGMRAVGLDPESEEGEE